MKDVLLLALMLLAAAWFFSGCSPCDRLSRRCPPIEYVRDSIVVYDTFTSETTITDTVLDVRLMPEYVYVQTQITDTARGETTYTTGLAWVDGNHVLLIMRNKDSAEVLVQRIHTLERQLRESYHEKETGKFQTVYKARGIVKVGAWIGLSAVVLVLLRFFLRSVRI